jgi:enamine deaminase RidA (YjgF/YER057c/UK114 family)
VENESLKDEMTNMEMTNEKSCHRAIVPLARLRFVSLMLFISGQVATDAQGHLVG